jgi:hypothetical protein
MPLEKGDQEADQPFNQLEDLAKEEETVSTEKDKWTDWISEDTWRLFDRRAVGQHRMSKQDAKMLTKEIKQSLAKDQKVQVEAAGMEIEAELTKGDPKSAFGKLKRWYHQTTGRPMKPTHEDTETLRKERKELYTKAEDLPPMFEVVEVPATVDDSIPTEREICKAIRKLKNGKAPGSSRITAEHLKKWMSKCRTDPKQWELVTKVVEEAFRMGQIPKRLSQSICVLIPKNEKGDYRGIGLLETIWKLIASIIDRRLGSGITLHNAHHGFWRGRGTGTAIMEMKL